MNMNINPAKKNLRKYSQIMPQPIEAYYEKNLLHLIASFHQSIFARKDI